MQSINIAVINRWFMAALFGTAFACMAVAVAAFQRWEEPAAAYVLAGALLYVVGTILVTILFNVPRNDALAAVSPSSTEAAAPWRRLPGHLDVLEPRSDGGGFCGVSAVHHGATDVGRLYRASPLRFR